MTWTVRPVAGGPELLTPPVLVDRDVAAEDPVVRELDAATPPLLATTPEMALLARDEPEPLPGRLAEDAAMALEADREEEMVSELAPRDDPALPPRDDTVAEDEVRLTAPLVAALTGPDDPAAGVELPTTAAELLSVTPPDELVELSPGPPGRLVHAATAVTRITNGKPDGASQRCMGTLRGNREHGSLPQATLCRPWSAHR